MITVTLSDERTAGAPLAIDTAQVALIAERVGVPYESDIAIKVVLRTKEESSDDAGDIEINDGNVVIAVHVLAKETYSEKALYQINKTLVHELRHLGQAAIGLELFCPDAVVFSRLAHKPEYCAISAGLKAKECKVEWSHVCSECGSVGEPVDFTDDGDLSEPVYIHNHPECKGEVTLSAYSLTE